MGQKKNYSRSFIILQENEKGHGISADKLPTGYAKIENRNGKCKVFFYVQNLKGTSKPYYMVLVCNKKDTKKLIKLGELKLDEYGKAEISREYSENDVGESGIGIDRVIGAAISQFNGNDMLVLMSGFNATDIPEDWRAYSLAGVKSKEVNSDAEKTIEVKKVETKPIGSKSVKVQTAEIKEKEVNTEVVKPNEVDRKMKDDVKDEEKHPDKKESVNIFDKYEESIENTKKDKYEDSKNIEVNEINNEKREENKCPCCSHEEQNNFESETHIEENSNRDYPIGRTGEFFKALTGELEDLGETFPDVRCCRWYRVPTDSIKHNYYREDHNKYTLLYYPMMPYYAYTQKSGCYLVGYKYDPKGKMKYLVYGILGTKNRCDQPFDGKTGFVSWVPMEKGKEGYEDKGCWLMFYDFKNAAILVPRR